MVVAGSVLSDTAYGAIAFFGIAPFLSEPGVVAFFWAANAVILTAIGIFALRGNGQERIENRRENGTLQNPGIAFVTGLSLAVTNPMMIYWWLLGARLIIEVGLVRRFSPSESLLFLLAGSCGIATYLTLLTVGVYRAKRFLSQHLLHTVTAGLAIALFGLALYSLIRSASTLLG